LGLKGNRSGFILFLVSILAGFLGTSNATAATKWVHQFTPVRELYISPSGTGTGTQSNPMSFLSAINTAAAGDLYWMSEGTYTGYFTLYRDGTADKPIVFRALPQNRVTLEGTIDMSGMYNWVWGLEITDPNQVSPVDSGIRTLSEGSHVINNIIHDNATKNGIGAWDHGPNHVIYGNIVYANGLGGGNPHNIYMQNDFASNGYKYIVGNLFLDSANICPNCFNVHAYTANGFVTGFYMKDNVISNGKFLLGGYNVPSDRHFIKKNYFYSSTAQFGYRRPSQAKVRKNYLVRTQLDVGWFWGVGEVQYTQTAPNQFTKNEIYLPPNGIHVGFITSAYLISGRCEGCPAIQVSDSFNNNKYSAPFRATFFADNTNLGTVDLGGWKNATSVAGNAFDSESKEVPLPVKNKIVVLPNDYEPRRGHVAIYNWEGSTDVNVNISSIVNSGSSVKIFSATDPFGTPIFSGTYNGSVSLPMSGAEFKVFLVQGD
jgi:hypothetical protein